MARFTKIPETGLAGNLGGLVGKAAGTVAGNAEQILINKVQVKLTDFCSKISQEDLTVDQVKSIQTEVNQIDQTLNTIESTLIAVETQTTSLQTAIAAVQIPITALKVAIPVIKALPIPQMYTVVAVPMVFGDLLQMLSELVAQIEQIVATLQAAIRIILSIIQKIRALIERFRQILAALKAALSLLLKSGTAEDQQKLQTMGIVNQLGQPVFGQLGSAMINNHSSIIWIGDLDGLDTSSLALENQIKATPADTIVDVPVGSLGNWISFVYKHSQDQPAKPEGQDPEPKDWNLIEPQNITDEWYSKGTVSGLTGKVVSWTEPVPYNTKFPKSPGKKTETLLPITKSVHVYRMSQGKVAATFFNLKETHAIVLQDGEESLELMYSLLDNIDKSTVSQDIKDVMETNINRPGTGSQTEQRLPNTIYGRAVPSGKIYIFELKNSTVSPKVATRRYVNVLDLDRNTVYTGAETFATDPDILYDETAVRLGQLLGETIIINKEV